MFPSLKLLFLCAGTRCSEKFFLQVVMDLVFEDFFSPFVQAILFGTNQIVKHIADKSLLIYYAETQPYPICNMTATYSIHTYTGFGL